MARVRAPLGRLAFAATMAALCSVSTRAAPSTLEVLGTARTNNRTESLVFRVAPHQAHVSELRIRSGSLAITLVGIEIEFADGNLTRVGMQETLPPGQQSQPIPVESRRAVSKVFVTKRPGLRPGETTIQLLGKIEPAPGGRRP
jgi:hypothetical protein